MLKYCIIDILWRASLSGLTMFRNELLMNLYDCARYEKPPKNHSLDVGKKIYLINAMAPDPVEMAALRVISINSIENTATITLTLSLTITLTLSLIQASSQI